jgi:hypothetical protein
VSLERFVVWSRSALDQIHNNKHGFEIPLGILVNTDDKQIAASDEVTSVLRPPLQTFSVPFASGSRPRNCRWYLTRSTRSGQQRRPKRIAPSLTAWYIISVLAPYADQNLRHEKACSGAQKRVFHARNQRIAGTEARSFMKAQARRATVK